MQSFMLSSKSAQFLEYVDLRTRTITSSDEIDSLGLFTVGFKTLQSYIMNVWHQISVARIQPVR